MDALDFSKPHFCRVGTYQYSADDGPSGTDFEAAQRALEPWLSALLQSEHLATLVGSGLTAGVCAEAGIDSPNMEVAKFGLEHDEKVAQRAAETAQRAGRAAPNIEDQLRSALALLEGLHILGNEAAGAWQESIAGAIRGFIGSVLSAERSFIDNVREEEPAAQNAGSLLTGFVEALAARVPTRDRLHLFTTNYDRFLEYACDEAGIRILDRFVGTVMPELRSPPLDVDLHYSPPGTRGEPRYLEGALRLTKLHGSIDWRSSAGRVYREALPFGAHSSHPSLSADLLDTGLIYPNPAKDIETTGHPYSELFRDFSAAICRPNSTLITYGYGFGDSHVNRVIRDMLTIPSTHLLIISNSGADGRINTFLRSCPRHGQVSVMIGPHFGSFPTLVNHYLPAPGAERVRTQRAQILQARGSEFEQETLGNSNSEQN